MRTGKARAPFLKRTAMAHLGLPSDSVLVGPGPGLDNAVVSLGSGRVLIVTVDPVSALPSLGMRTSAWLSVHLVASDFASSGCRPQFATFSYAFPPEMTERDGAEYIRSVGAACRGLGVAIVGGHTGAYPGVSFPIVGAGSMFGEARSGGYVTPAMARQGDAVLLAGRAGDEAAAYLALSFPETARGGSSAGVGRWARRALRRCSTVRDSLAAAEVGLGAGRVTSMHDVTEGGVIGALEEVSAACGKRLRVDLAAIEVSEEAAAVCRAFDVDPLASPSEGSLLITCAAEVAEDVAGRLGREGTPVVALGTVGEGKGARLSAPGRAAGAGRGYWDAYGAAAERGLP